MNKESFETKFPGLKFYLRKKVQVKRVKNMTLPEAKLYNNDLGIIEAFEIGSCQSEINTEEMLEIPTKDIINHCLDKTKVLEAFNKCIECLHDSEGGIYVDLYKLFEKELGLGEVFDINRNY